MPEARSFIISERVSFSSILATIQIRLLPALHHLYSLLLLPISNFVNSCGNRAGIGLNECPKRAHSPFLSVFHSAPFSLLSRLDYCPLCPPAVQSIVVAHTKLCQFMSKSGRHRPQRMSEARIFTIFERVSIGCI